MLTRLLAWLVPSSALHWDRLTATLSQTSPDRWTWDHPALDYLNDSILDHLAAFGIEPDLMSGTIDEDDGQPTASITVYLPHCSADWHAPHPDPWDDGHGPRATP